MTLLIAFLVFALAVLLMSLGVILGGRRIQGSCGGLGNIPGIESDCGGVCRREGGKPREACHRRSKSCAEDGLQTCEQGSAEAGSTRSGTSDDNTR